MANFSGEEKEILANWLTDPLRVYASTIGQEIAAHVIAALVQQQ